MKLVWVAAASSQTCPDFPSIEWAHLHTTVGRRGGGGKGRGGDVKVFNVQDSSRGKYTYGRRYDGMEKAHIR